MISRYKLETNIYRFFVYLVLIVLLLITIVPIWVLIINATRSTSQIQQGLAILPSTFADENYNILLGRGLDLPKGFINSVYLSTFSTILAVYFGFMTAYGIVVYNFKGKKFMNNFIVLLVLIPMQLSIIGFYQYMAKIGLTDTYWPLILPNIAAAGSVFFAKQYLEAVVIQDLIDAARIDGAGELGIFHKIMIPLATPGMFTLGIFSWVGTWNNFITPFIFISTVEKFTMPMQVQRLQGDVFRTEYGSVYLGLAFTIVPILVIYAVFSRYIVSGIAMGAVKD
ncbi:MAG: carbohydrate ABC transporter permease [Anaerolineales bacterium]|nr:carbohydrate ABC transporter permease [Anaerolineales bacterium]